MAAIKQVELVFGNFALPLCAHAFDELLSYFLGLLGRIIILLQNITEKCPQLLPLQNFIVILIIPIEILVKELPMFLFVK